MAWLRDIWLRMLVAIADDDQNAADDGLVGGDICVEEFVGAGLIDGVVEGGGAAGALLADGLLELVEIVGEILGDFGLIVEGHDEGLVSSVMDDVVEKIHGGVLLELEALANAVGGVEQQADAQGDIGLASEELDGLRDAVVKDAEIFLLQIGDQFLAAIEDGKLDVHQVDNDWQGGGRLPGLRRCGRGGLRGGRRWGGAGAVAGAGVCAAGAGAVPLGCVGGSCCAEMDSAAATMQRMKAKVRGLGMSGANQSKCALPAKRKVPHVKTTCGHPPKIPPQRLNPQKNQPFGCDIIGTGEWQRQSHRV